MRENIVALGFFDGVHLGHQAILEKAVDWADNLGIDPIVVTFSNQPRAFLTNTSGNLITSNEVREEYMRHVGIKEVYMLPFDAQMAAMSPEDFVKDVLVGQFNCKGVVCGQNYTFGARGSGRPLDLIKYGAQYGFECQICDSVKKHDQTVSSTIIRNALLDGDVGHAVSLLGHPYVIRGVIEPGRGVGRKLGFPTGNISIDKTLLAPKYGVYAARITMRLGSFACALNIGVRPTFGLDEVVAEFNIIDFEGDIYGEEIELELKRFIRPERIFDSPEELAYQISRDIDLVKEYQK